MRANGRPSRWGLGNQRTGPALSGVAHAAESRVKPTMSRGLHDSNAISEDRFTLPYICYMNTISRTLALLKPADLFPAWKWIDIMEECGEIEADEARRRKGSTG